MTRVTNLLEDFANFDKNGRVTAGCDLRVLATEADLEYPINPDAATMIKQDHVDDHVEGGDVRAKIRKVKKGRTSEHQSWRLL